jgi:hypothetical protein
MNWKNDWKTLTLFLAVFLGLFHLPVDSERFRGALVEAFALAAWYAREHVLLCLIPAFFIAGAIGVFINQAAVMKYLGADAPKPLAYGVASVSGTILAVCSCTVLPLFAGIYRMGAGLGPATAFLYSGPAINVLAIVLTAAVLGPELGIARAVGAVVFSIVIGLAMHAIFRNEEARQLPAAAAMTETGSTRPLWRTAVYFASMVGILVFANWGRPQAAEGVWWMIFQFKWPITAGFSLLFAGTLIAWFDLRWRQVALAALPALLAAIIRPDAPLIAFVLGTLGLCVLTSSKPGESGDWFAQSWGFAKQILPLLFIGVLIAGLLLGRPGHEGLIPSDWIARSVGGNSLAANFFAAFAGAFMYFATLTEVPILQGLLGAGMGKGPALALLLAGPALSLPSMLVIRGVLGTTKTLVYIALVVVMATFSGFLYGSIYG